MVQESLGFSPADLVFAHTVRGPLKLLQEKWLDDSKLQNLCDYVSNFCFKLHRACELAKQSMSVCADINCADVVACSQFCAAGLLQWPLCGSGKGKGDYIVATPERKRRSRLCHINMLKPFLDRQPVLFSPVNDAKTVLVLSGAELIDEAQVAGALSSADPSAKIRNQKNT